MSKTKIMIAACLLSQVILGQNEQKKPLADFDQLSVNVNTVVYLQRSDAPFISITQKDSGLNIKAEVVNGKLTVQSQGKGPVPDKITVGYVKINAIDATGAASIKSNETLNGESLKLELNGAAKCKFEITLNTVSCLANGASTISLSGTVQKMDAIITGAASLKALDLTTQEGYISVSGAATAKVNVVSKLNANASGAATLKYGGDPKETQVNQTGAATIKKISADGSAETQNPGTKTTSSDSVKHYKFNDRFEIIVRDKKDNDTTVAGEQSKSHKNRVRKKNWSGIELFENGYLTPDNNVTLPSNYDYLSPNYGIKNLGCNLNLMEKDFRFANGKLQFVTGLGFSFNSYALKNKTVLNSDSSYTGYAYNSDATYSKNKLKESFVTVPLLFELNTSKKESRNFHIAAGVIGGLKLGSRTKQIYELGGHEFHEVKKDDYNLFPFKLDATVRVGYGAFTMFATYSLTPLFEYGKGPELYPFTVGIRIIPF